MIIQLTPERRLNSDEHQFSLEKRKLYRGKEVWRPYRFYASLAGALAALPEQLLKESTAHGFTEVNSFLEQLKTLLIRSIATWKE